MRTVVFVNTRSRQSRRVIDRLNLDLSDSQFNIVDFIRIGPSLRFDTGLARLCRHKRLDCVIIAGGDGTIAGVTNVLLRRKVKIGIVPLGTGNSFARSLGLPLEYEAALAVIKGGKMRQASIGTINGKVFVNAAAIGLSASTAHRISDRSKRYLGRLAYLISGTRQFLFHRPFDCVLETTKKTYHFTTHEIIIANGRYYGGKPVDSHTSVHKDYLTFVMLGPDKSRIRYGLGQLQLLLGRQEQSGDTISISAQRATITTNPGRRVHADGEVIAETPAEFEIKPKAVTVFVP